MRVRDRIRVSPSLPAHFWRSGGTVCPFTPISVQSSQTEQIRPLGRVASPSEACRPPSTMTVYAVLYMAATRTQIYLTKEQRRALDARMRRDDKSLAQLIREAI